MRANERADANGLRRLLFHFRASDPAVYQEAAEALGRRLIDDPDLRTSMEAYAARHGLALTGEVPLVGVRGPRRILLLRSSARAHWLERRRESPGSATPWEPEDPLPARPGEALPGNPRDLAVRFRAEELVLRADPDAGRARRCMELVGEVATDPRRRWDRASVRRWTGLMAAAVEVDPAGQAGPALESWRAFAGLRVQRHPVDPGATVPQRVENLVLLDQAVRGLASLPSSLARRALGGAADSDRSKGGEIVSFLVLRYRIWRRRLGADGAKEGTVPGTPAGGARSRPDRRGPARDPMDWLEEWTRLLEGESSEGGPGFDPGEPGESLRREHLRALLCPMRTSEEWQRMTPHRRSMWAFLVLDVLADGRGSQEIVAVARAELARDGATRESDPPGRLVLRLVSHEGPGAEAMVDPRFIHQGTGDDLLLALVPVGRRSDLLPVLADSIEHRLRLSLSLDAGVRAERALLRVSVRDPHPELWEELSTLVEGRSYVNLAGEEIDMEGLLARLREGTLPPEGRIVSALEAVAAGDRPSEGGTSPAAGEGEEDAAAQGVGEDLRRLASLLDGREPREGGDPANLVSLVLWINHDRDRCLSREAAGGEGPEPSDVRERCQEWARGLLGIEADIAAGTASSGEILATRKLLGALRAYLLPLLPAATSGALASAVTRLDGPLGDETSALALLESLRTDGADPGPGRAADDSERIRLVLRASGHPVQGVLSPAALEAWRIRVGSLWHRSLEEAMHRGYESRVRRLVRARGVETLLRGPASLALLERTRRWWFDRYALTEGWKVTPLMNRIDGRRRRKAGDVVRFLGAFAPLWLALLIGAVLMLDFGDAWRAMVEAEDLRGIVITFVVGGGGALGYLAFELKQKVSAAPEDRIPAGPAIPGTPRGFPLARLFGFFGLCLGYALAVTSLLWLLLSRTDEVIHGPWAPGHVVVWAGFALFVGVFFGMIAKE